MAQVLKPSDFRLSKFGLSHAVHPSEKRLRPEDVRENVAKHLTAYAGALPADFIEACRKEAEELDRLGRLKPPTMRGAARTPPTRAETRAGPGGVSRTRRRRARRPVERPPQAPGLAC